MLEDRTCLEALRNGNEERSGLADACRLQYPPVRRVAAHNR
jgi:hypothetical protein